ncbi:MAG: orotidine-5'-phosphate decarboxylase [Ignavibacteriae bacterium HGW-Ignavibacteriae-2]|jgi:orotidine-5'-phosphate decarboxylase|nr:MAG: orotidine-5'-phosphate decarboxylase [Ignavibacteriae bacterium HGW-Ignavibacteriae-2]
MKSVEKLTKRLEEGKHICIGLDSDRNKIPEYLRNDEDGILKFNRNIIESTKEDVCAYKINLAFYEKEGKKGIDALERTMDLMPEDVFVIGDAKRGDIGNTSEMYAYSIFEHFLFDSVTLHPYMGYDSLLPFFEYEDKINFILALTSNAGSLDFEKLKLDSGKYLYQEVINKAVQWNTKNNLGVVFGATNPIELKEEIDALKSLFVLLPGVGAQGGSLEDVASTFYSAGNKKFLVNVSRAIIYSDSTENFASSASENLKNYNQKIKIIVNA